MTVWSAADEVAVLQEAWSSFRRLKDREVMMHGGTPLAETEFDQVSEGDNPFWEIVRWMPAEKWMGGWSPKPLIMLGDVETMLAMMRRGLTMDALQRRFAWAIPSPTDLSWMAGLLAGRGVVEIGAGTGYWAWMLEQVGVKVAAYDLHPLGEDNRYCTGGPYVEIRHGGPEAATKHPDRALLLSWPPNRSEMASRSLAAFNGDLLFFAGESNPDVVADKAFYETLAAEWEPVSAAPRHVPWWGVHCRLTAWTRNWR